MRGEMHETTDMPQHSELGSKEISDEAREKFDRLMGDDELPNHISFYNELDEGDNTEKNLDKILDEYFDDLIESSDYPDTIDDKPFEVSDLEKLTPEQNAEMREEFDDKKTQLKQEWEETYNIPWPKYEEDVYSSNGKLIRKEGSDYDAHHIQPLGMGGKNVAENITPLNAEVHYDKQGVHAPNSPYSELDKKLGGIE